MKRLVLGIMILGRVLTALLSKLAVRNGDMKT